MKIIVIDGTDGTGKETQSKLLVKNLEELGFKVKSVSFPQYDNDSSILVSRYLNGEYGQNPDQINPYAASVLYSVDRLNYFLTEDFNDCDFLICDRYTTSNLIHQASKIDDPEERDQYINWLLDFEFNKLALPKPDSVIYLNLSPEKSKKLINKRNQDKDNLDIHESNQSYLKKCADFTQDYANKNNWTIINCDQNQEIRSIESIQQEILSEIKDKYM